MPSRGLRYTKDIAKLRAQGRSDAEIAEQIGIAKSIVHRNLHRTRTQQRLARILADTGLYALKQVLASTEVVYRWTEQERLKLLEGQSQLTAENVGTLVRMQDKNLLLAKALLGNSEVYVILRCHEKLITPLPVRWFFHRTVTNALAIVQSGALNGSTVGGRQ